MTKLIVTLKHPWYDPEGYYRRVEDNPHVIDTPAITLAELPSSAQVTDTAGNKEYVWKARGEIDPAARQKAAANEVESEKLLPLAKALQGDSGSGEALKKLQAENAELKKKLAAKAE